MNSIVLILLALVIFIIAYFTYGNFLAKKWGISNDHKTPAEEINDGTDYVPTNNVVVLGHQFSSIAGAGPITGVIQAVAFGWLPVFLWIIGGTIFIGGVHDYSSLFASVRHQGKSIGEIINKHLGGNAKKLFNIFAWLTLMLILGAFTYFVAASFSETAVSGSNVYAGTGAKIATASFLICFAAILFGIINHFKKPVWLNSIICVALLVVAIVIGFNFPFLNFSIGTWFILVSIYILLAANLPAWVMLQPRGYLVSYLLYGIIAFSLIGVFVAHPSLKYMDVANMNAPSCGGFIFPFLFVTVACGAVSGFHSLVSSGTTSKTVKKEKPDIKLAGYGAMLIEGFFAVLVIGVAATARASGSTAGGFSLFYAGIGAMFSHMGMSYDLGYQIGGLAFSMFCLTSLDTATRIARYMFNELADIKKSENCSKAKACWCKVMDFFSSKQLSSVKESDSKVVKFFKENKVLGAICATLMTVIPGYILSSAKYGTSAAYNVIWPIFGSANQLLAAIALLAVTAWLVKTAKDKKTALYTGIPTIFMFAVTLSALVLFFITKCKELASLAEGVSVAPTVILMVLAVLLFVLAILLIIKAIKVLFIDSKKQEEVSA